MIGMLQMCSIPMEKDGHLEIILTKMMFSCSKKIQKA